MSDRITVRCPHCAAGFRVAAESVGRKGKCRQCGEVFTLAAEPQAASAKAPAVGMKAPALPMKTPPAKPVQAQASASSARVAAPAAKRQPPPQIPEADEYDIREDIDLDAPPPLAAPVTTVKSGSGFSAGKSTAKSGAAASKKSSASSGWGGNKKAKSDDSPSMLKKIGGVLFSIFVVLAVIGKIIRGYNRVTHDSSSTSGSVSRAKPDSLGAADPPPRTGPFPAVQPLQFVSAGKYQSATIDVSSRHAARTNVRLFIPRGTHADKSLPCVFVCPAGSNLIVGVPFGPDEHEDFLPMVDKGMAVCFYTLDGEVQDLETASEPTLERAAVAYRRSDGGLANLADAIDVVLGGTPMIDPARLGTCGHSSAATIALMAAAREPRISTAAAMAPAIDVATRLGSEIMNGVGPVESNFIHAASPIEIASLSHPVYIYHCRDDDNCPASESSKFAAKFGSQVTLELAAEGGHGGAYYDGKNKAFDYLAKTLSARPVSQ